MKRLVPLLIGSMLLQEAAGMAMAEAPKSSTDGIRPAQALGNDKSPNIEKVTTRLLQHPSSIDKALVSLGRELAAVDSGISRLLVYVNGLAFQHRALGLLVWNSLNASLLRTKRFELVDIRESQMAQLTIEPGRLRFSNTIESNKKLLAMASRNKADAVMIAEVIATEEQLVLTLQLIRASDSLLVWTGCFPVPVGDEVTLPKAKPPMSEDTPLVRKSEDTPLVRKSEDTPLVCKSEDKSISVYAGAQFFGMRREAVSVGIEDSTFWNMPALGLRGLKRLNDSPLWLGMDMCLSRGTLVPGYGDLAVCTVMPVFAYALDPLWGGKSNVLSVFAGAGPGLALGGRGFLISGAQEGLSINITSLLELSIGLIQVPSFVLDLYPENDYSTQASFGGTALLVMVGKSF